MMKWTRLLILLSMLNFCGCVKLENSRRLIARPDFAAAALAAPEWTRDALKTINQLEERIEAGQ